MKTININHSDVQMPFITPPEYGGQMVSFSYTCTEDYILESKHDLSDGTGMLIAYHWPKNGVFDPQNKTPNLGRRVGAVNLVN